MRIRQSSQYSTRHHVRNGVSALTLLQYASNHNDVLAPKWREFFPRFRKRWNQTPSGEHVFLYGETGSGKTELGALLANSESYAVAMVTKPLDPIFKSPLYKGYRRVKKWNPNGTDTHVMLSAPMGKSMNEERANQRALFPGALDSIYREKNWTVLFDEGMHMSTTLGMKQQVSDFFYLGRGYGLTGIMCSQRPRMIPAIVPQSCEHAFISRSRRDDDLSTLAELGRDKRELRQIMRGLRSKHDFIYIDTQEKLPVQIINTHY